jgi:hypothetical protein
LPDLTKLEVQALIDALADATDELRAEVLALRQQLYDPVNDPTCFFSIHPDDHVRFWTFARRWGRGQLRDFIGRVLLRHDIEMRNHGLFEPMQRLPIELEPDPADLPVEPEPDTADQPAEPAPLSADEPGPADGADERELVSDRTGAPGQPSSLHLVEREFTRRIAAGELVKPGLKEQATELRAWFVAKYPGLRPMTVGTIENHIREDYWKAHRKPTE